MAFNLMKRIIDKDLGMHSRVIPVTPILTINTCEKLRKRARMMLLILWKQDFGKILIFSEENSPLSYSGKSPH
jgi:hypothetical protein